MNELALPVLWAICCAIAAWQARFRLWTIFAIPPFLLTMAAWAYQEFVDTGVDEFGIRNLLRLAALWGAIVVALSGLGLHLRRKSGSSVRPEQGS